MGEVEETWGMGESGQAGVGAGVLRWREAGGDGETTRNLFQMCKDSIPSF